MNCTRLLHLPAAAAPSASIFPRRSFPPSFLPRATSPEGDSEIDTANQTEEEDFDARLSKVQLKYRVGSGKKAEMRKNRKSGTSVVSKREEMYLPAVPLREPISGGLKVELGFSSYSERVNGRIAILGIVALLLVELATGESVIKYHSPSILLVQLYFVAAVGALYIKYEKEKGSVWPQ